MAGLGGIPSGPGVPGIDPALAGQVQYQTHTFAPPVTGPPVKKPKLTNTPSMGNIGGGVGGQPTLPSLGTFSQFVLTLFGSICAHLVTSDMVFVQIG